MASAITEALKDTGVPSSKLESLKANIDSLSVVLSWTWPYPDLIASVAGSVGIEPKQRYLSPHGGNQSGKIFDEAARAIAMGKTTVAVLTGGEALASRMYIATTYLTTCYQGVI